MCVCVCVHCVCLRRIKYPCPGKCISWNMFVNAAVDSTLLFLRRSRLEKAASTINSFRSSANCGALKRQKQGERERERVGVCGGGGGGRLNILHFLH